MLVALLEGKTLLIGKTLLVDEIRLGRAWGWNRELGILSCRVESCGVWRRVGKRFGRWEAGGGRGKIG